MRQDHGRYAMSAEQVSDELTFRTYVYNREQSPNTPIELWRPIFGDKLDELERRFQHERLLDRGE